MKFLNAATAAKFLSADLIWNFLVFVLALSPTYLVRFSFGSIPTTLFEVFILLLTLVVLLRGCIDRAARVEYVKKLKSIPWPAVVVVTLFFSALTISVFVSFHMRAALGIWKAYGVDALLLGVIAWLHINSIAQIKRMTLVVSVAVGFVAFVGIIQKFTGWWIPNPFWRATATRRITSVFGYPNAVGLYLEMVLPFLVALFFITKKFWLRIWLALVVGGALAAIFFAHSSGTLAALAVATFFVSIYFRITRWPVIIICVLTASVIFLSSYRQPFADEFLLQGFSGQLRVQMWKETTRMLRERPILGAGLANYQTRVKPFHLNKKVEIYLYPHNLILTLWSEIGLLGLGAFSFLFVYLLVVLVRALRRSVIGLEKRVWILALLSWLIIIVTHGLVDTPYFKNDLAAWFWVGVALILYFGYTENLVK